MRKITQQEMAEREKQRLMRRIASVRYEHETGGTTVNGTRIATDRQSQTMLVGAIISAKDAKETRSPFDVNWKGPGGFASLDADQIIEVGRAVRAHVQACFNREEELINAIEAGTFSESMLDEGWPT